MNKTRKRLSLVILCVLMLFSLGCPAFASGYYAETPGYIYAGSKSVAEASFTFVDGLYTAPLGSGSLKTEEASECLVTFSDVSYKLKWYYYGGDAGEQYFVIGNASFFDSDLADTGEDFVLVLDRVDKTQSFFSCNPDFFSEYIQGTGDEGFVIYFSVPEEGFSVSSLMDDVGSVFGSGISMVGSVVSTITSTPLLYLPIIIGLCGIGIAFFRRLKQ